MQPIHTKCIRLFNLKDFPPISVARATFETLT